MPLTETPASPDDALPARDGASSSVRRILLTVGVAVTLVSLLGLLGALGAYFLHQDWPFLPTLYRLSLFGLPLGFAFLVLHLVWSAVARSRA